MEAAMIADRPVVEVGGPRIHLRRREARGILDESGDETSLEPSRFPERYRQRVVLPMGLRELASGLDRDAEYLLRDDPVASHSVAVTFRSLPLERAKQRDNGLSSSGCSLAGHRCRK